MNMMLTRELERVASWVNTLARFSRDHVGGTFLKMEFVVIYTILLTWALFPATVVLESAGHLSMVVVASLADDEVFGVKMILLCAANLYFGEKCFILKAGLIICAFSVSIIIVSYTILLKWALFPAWVVPESAGHLSMVIVDSLADEERGNRKAFVAKLVLLCAATGALCFVEEGFIWKAGLIICAFWVPIMIFISIIRTGPETSNKSAAWMTLTRQFQLVEDEIDALLAVWHDIGGVLLKITLVFSLLIPDHQFGPVWMQKALLFLKAVNLVLFNVVLLAKHGWCEVAMLLVLDTPGVCVFYHRLLPDGRVCCVCTGCPCILGFRLCFANSHWFGGNRRVHERRISAGAC